MIKTLNEAKEYVFDRIEKISGDIVDETEKAIVSTFLEEKFFNKIWSIISDEEMEALKAENMEELEWKLFYKIPNYVSLLEDSTAEFLADYLSTGGEEWESEE